MKAEILTSWTEGPDGRFPTLLSAHPLPLGASSMDATGQQLLLPDPNTTVVQVWYVPVSYLDAVEAANPGSVLWSAADESA